MTSRWPEHSLAILCGTSGNGDARVDGYFFKASRTVTWLEPSPTKRNQEGLWVKKKTVIPSSNMLKNLCLLE